MKLTHVFRERTVALIVEAAAEMTADVDRACGNPGCPHGPHAASYDLRGILVGVAAVIWKIENQAPLHPLNAMGAAALMRLYVEEFHAEANFNPLAEQVSKAVKAAQQEETGSNDE